MTVVIGAASIVGIVVSLWWRTSVPPIRAAAVFLLFGVFQLLAVRVSLLPYIASR